MTSHCKTYFTIEGVTGLRSVIVFIVEVFLGLGTKRGKDSTDGLRDRLLTERHAPV